MRNIFNAVLYPKMPNTSEEKKAEMARDPLDQRCYPELLVALSNSDINLDKIKAQVNYILIQTLSIHGK